MGNKTLLKVIENENIDLLQDNFGGDSYKRKEIAPNLYQCGCHWVHYDKPYEVPDLDGVVIQGDFLVECPFHKFVTENSK